MKRRHPTLICTMLTVLLSLGLLTGCGPSSPGPEDASGVAAEAAQTVYIQADGRRIAIEDPRGKTLSDYLKEAGVTLNEGDMLTFDSDQDVTGDVTVSVLRMTSVSVLVVSPDAPEGIQHSAVCYGGTVADALRSVGIELADGMSVSTDPGTPLRDDMTIVVTVFGSGQGPEEAPEEEPPAQEASGPSSPSRSGSHDSPEEESPSGPASGSGPSSGSSVPSGGDGSGASGSSPAGERYVVGVEVYEDCDGSGHGVKVYTYSDGSQEEVLY